jgi:hypothetical protein
MLRSRSLLTLLVVALIALPAFSQKYTGTIRGIVTDASGAMVPNAQVTAINPATNSQRTATAVDGEYAIQDLPAGTYTVKASGKGFKETVARNVELHVASIATVNMKLEVGSTSETVTVEASAVQVQTTSASVGEVVDGQQVRELPLNGRSFAQLTQLQPGVSADNTFDPKKKGLESGVDFSVNGNPTTNNLFLVDGANNNDVGSNRTILVYPSIDAISEFKMLRNSYGPEYGQASGSVITIVTRSGGNAFHGGASYFGRNDKLNATEFFAAREGAAAAAAGAPLPNNGKDKLRRNDYSYHIGGPILKDRFFFFWNQEWNKEIRGETRRSCVPTQAERNGDFSQGVSCDAAVPDPAFVPGGIIPNPDPTGLLIAQLFPLPNVIPTAANDFNNWVQSVNSSINWREENLRLDYNITRKHTATFRYTQDSWKNPAPNALDFWGDDPFPTVEGNWDQPSKSIVGKVTSLLTNTLVNDAQFSYSNNRINITTGGTTPDLPNQINATFPGIYPESGKRPGGLPTIWSGLGPYGDFNNLWLISPFNNGQDLYTVRDDLSKTYKNHTFKGGIYLSWDSKHENDFGGHERPDFGAADWAVANPTGNELANILLPGQTFLGMHEASVTPTAHTQWRDYEFYFGDTWKARGNLTLEYGLRWSLFREPFDENDLISSWDFRFYNPLGDPSDVCNGLVIVPGTDPCGNSGLAGLSSGTPGPNRSLRENNNHAIAPRLGLSWDPSGEGKMAIRVGVGQFFQRERVSPYLTAAFNAPFSISSVIDRSFAVAPAPESAAGSPSGAIDPRGVLPNSWQWNLSVERELARQTTLQIGYVGNRGIHLTGSYDTNPVLPQNRTAAAFDADNTAFRLAPTFGKITRFGRDGWSTYHALQTMLRSRITRRVNLQAVYTWSHSIADYDLNDSSGNTGGHSFSDPLFNSGNAVDKGNSSINRPHIFVANVIVNLPTLQGQNGFVRNVLGDWEFAAITSAASGTSQTIFNRGVSDENGSSLANLSGTGLTDNQRPNINPGVGCNDSVAGAGREQIFNPDAFSVTGFRIGSIGNAPRGYCRGPSFVNSDLALYKNWRAAERLNIQFRLEFFNAFNRPNFIGGDLDSTGKGINVQWAPPSVVCGTMACDDPANPSQFVITGLAPGTTINDAFGKATRTRGPREIQYALKFTF